MRANRRIKWLSGVRVIFVVVGLCGGLLVALSLWLVATPRAGKGPDLLLERNLTVTVALLSSAPTSSERELLSTLTPTPVTAVAAVGTRKQVTDSRPTSTSVPTATATAMAKAAAVTYIPVDDPCVRPADFRGGGGPGRDFLDIATGEAVLARLHGHKNLLHSAAFSPDGRKVVTADWEEIRLWETATGQLLYAFNDEELSSFVASAISPDGSLLATGIDGPAVRLRDLATGSVVRDLRVILEREPDSFVVGSLAYSPDGSQLAVAVGRTIILIDAVTGNTARELAGEVFGETENGSSLIGDGHALAVTALAYSPDAQVLVSASGDATLRLWDVNSGEHLRCFELNTVLYGVAMHPGGRTAGVRGESVIYFLDIVNGRLLDSWQATGTGNLERFIADGYEEIEYFTSIQFSNDGQRLLVGMGDQTARVYDSTNGTLTALMRHPRPVKWAEFSPDGKRIVTAIGSSDDFTDKPVYEAWIWDGIHPAIALAAAAQDLVEEGLARAESGDVSGALALFEQAQALNPYAEYDLAREGRSRAGIALYILGVERARTGDLDGAISTLGGMAQIDPATELVAHSQNALCWYGTLWGQAERVLPICELAVAAAASEGSLADFRDSRGIARALAGDYLGAIEDFTAFVAYDEDSFIGSEEVAQRQEWIAALQAGRNPFDEAALAALRAEGDNDG
jgi:WD40 repeat protein